MVILGIIKCNIYEFRELQGLTEIFSSTFIKGEYQIICVAEGIKVLAIHSINYINYFEFLQVFIFHQASLSILNLPLRPV